MAGRRERGPIPPSGFPLDPEEAVVQLALAALGSMIGWPLFRLIKNIKKRGRLPDMKSVRVTITATADIFTADEVGNQVVVTNGAVSATINITTFTSTKVVAGNPTVTVDAALSGETA